MIFKPYLIQLIIFEQSGFNPTCPTSPPPHIVVLFPYSSLAPFAFYLFIRTINIDVCNFFKLVS